VVTSKDLDKIIALLPKFQTDREWLDEYRRESNITLAVLGFLTAGIFIAIIVMAVLAKHPPSAY